MAGEGNLGGRGEDAELGLLEVVHEDGLTDVELGGDRLTAGVAGIGLTVAGLLAFLAPPGPGLLPNLMPFAKVLVAGVGLLLLMLLAGTVDGTAAELATHARAAHDTDTAIRASIRAGDEAMAVGGPDDAATHFEAALELVGTGPPEDVDVVGLIWRTKAIGR